MEKKSLYAVDILNHNLEETDLIILFTGTPPSITSCFAHFLRKVPMKCVRNHKQGQSIDIYS